MTSPSKKIPEMVIYLLIREDLKMTKGKIAAQCGHAVENLILKCPKGDLQTYQRHGSPKICLKLKDEAELEQLRPQIYGEGIPHYIVVDAGRTQIPAGSMTCLGIGPYPKEKLTTLLQNFKLL
jgi:PTH2 family peptidyl-tRNA hydrolase